MSALWRIEMLGWLRAVSEERVLTRFRTHKTGALLAYLAYHAHRSHPRETLIELLWPEVEPSAGRQSLRKALSSLRQQLEPPGVPQGAVLLADRTSVQLNAVSVATDVAAFEASLSAAAAVESDAERRRHLIGAVELHSGELLPGHFEDWVLLERERLAELYQQALAQLAAALEAVGDLAAAQRWTLRAVAADPLREQPRRVLIRLLNATGQPEAAQRQESDLKELLSASPSRSVPVPAPSAPPVPPSRDHQSDPSTRPEPPSRRLPQSLNRFIGRDAELKRLQALLSDADTRLVTLTGPGGSGKTRLALEWVRRLAAGPGATATADSAQPPAVYFVPLLDLSDPRHIIEKVLDVLRLPRSRHLEPLDQVVGFLSRQPSLLVLDNFEHLVEGGALWVPPLLERVATLRVLVTSRQRLNVPGEQEYPLPPLPVPGVQVFRYSGVQVEAPQTPEHLNTRTPEHLIECPSVALFVDRAQAVRPDFQLTAGNAAAVAALCDRLEGLPLALELAAARIQVLTPAQMLARLEQRFELLVGRQRLADPRHRSLWATLDWSYQLLAPDLQRFFARLSIFRGGWTLEAAEAVCEEPRALAYLEQLCESSLVIAQEWGEERRFHCLETVREYALERLTGEEHSLVGRCHACYYLAVAERSEVDPGASLSVEQLNRMESEHENMQAALTWALETGEADLGLRLAGALGWFWTRQTYVSLARAYLERLLALPGIASAPIASRLPVLSLAGEFAMFQGDYDCARRLFGECLVLQERVGDRAGVAETYLGLTLVARFGGEYELARSLCEKRLQLWEALGNTAEVAVARYALGYVAYLQGDLDEAQTHLEASLPVLREQDNYEASVMWALTHLGEVADARGEYASARALLEEGLAILRALGGSFGMGWVQHRLGRVALHQGDRELARSSFAPLLTDVIWLEFPPGAINGLEGMAELAAARGQPEQAVRHFAAAEALRSTARCPLPPILQLERQRLLASLRATLGDGAFHRAWKAGQVLSWEQAAAEALAEGQAGSPRLE